MTALHLVSKGFYMHNTLKPGYSSLDSKFNYKACFYLIDIQHSEKVMYKEPQLRSLAHAKAPIVQPSYNKASLLR